MRTLVFVPALLGCHAPADPWFLTDADGDGFLALVDCDDARPAVFPGAPEVAGDGVDQDCDGVDPMAGSDPTGSAPDEAFGSAVAVRGSDWYAGAPAYAEGGLAMGRLWRDGEVVATGVPGDRLGASVAITTDGVAVVGAPGAGEVRGLDGSVLASGVGVGRAIVARGSTWATTTATGARTPTRSVEWGEAPFSLAIDASGLITGGFPLGETAVRTEAGAIAAAQPLGEAGAAILYADADGDGDEELIVGAPGESAVYICDPTALPASLAGAPRIAGDGGRFGASLAALPGGVLLVGAPMADGGAGRVWRIEALGAPSGWLDGVEGDQLGFSLATSPEGVVIVGAPGPADGPGMARIRPQ